MLHDFTRARCRATLPWRPAHFSALRSTRPSRVRNSRSQCTVVSGFATPASSSPRPVNGFMIDPGMNDERAPRSSSGDGPSRPRQACSVRT